MKIIDVIEGKVYRVETDHNFLGFYRRIDLSNNKAEWEHLVNEREKTWIPVSELTVLELEEAYKEWVRKNG